MTSLLAFFEEAPKNTIDWAVVGIAVAVMVALALVIGLLILLVSKFCEVKVDPKIDEIYEHLPHANCGGCGYAGCMDFAKAIAEGKADVADCGQTTKTNRVEISNIMGNTTEGAGEETISVVACNGGNKCSDKYGYQGYGTCTTQNLLAGGRKSCDVGCMGAGTCVDVCPYNCIECYDGYSHIDPELCRSCGLCIKACPKKLIKRIPKKAKVYVACSTQCRGKDVMSVCKAGCIACGICEKTCPARNISLE
ncbi:MAG: (Fe-S)-binding protein, partial [Clostridia bacterium]